MFSVWIFLFMQVTMGQNQVLTGIVTDESTGETLVGVNVFLENKTGTATDLDGRFRIPATPGTHTLKFSYIGYQNLDTTVVVPENVAEVSEHDIIDACKDRLANFKVPKRVVFVDE